MSMVIICYASDIIECGRRTPEPSNAPLQITQDANSIEKKTLQSYLRLILGLTCKPPRQRIARNAMSLSLQ